MILHLAAVGLGGAIGAVLRWLGAGYVTRLAGSELIGNLSVNVIGCFGMGVLFALLLERTPGSWSELALFAIVGVLGAFTAFSAFSLDTILMLEHGRIANALAYAGGSVALALLAVFVGLQIAHRFL